MGNKGLCEMQQLQDKLFKLDNIYQLLSLSLDCLDKGETQDAKNAVLGAKTYLSYLDAELHDQLEKAWVKIYKNRD